MIDLAVYFLGWGVLAVLVLGTAAQLAWQGYRILTAPVVWRFNAAAIFFLTIAAIAPPMDYPALDRMIICAFLVIFPSIAAAFGDPGRWKLLSVFHILAACTWVYICVQAAR